MIDRVKQFAEEVARRALFSSADEWGLVHLSQATILDVIDSAIYFTDDAGSDLERNAPLNPKMSLSLIDIKRFDGLQVKGVVREVESYKPVSNIGERLYQEHIASRKAPLFRLDLAEVYDLMQKQTSLRVPEWNNPVPTGYQSTRIAYRPFVPPKEVEMPQPLRQALSELQRKLYDKRQPVFVGTTEQGGSPNLSPRFLLDASQNFLLWGDKFKNKTFLNFSRPSPISVYAVDLDTRTGYELKGWASFHFFGKTMMLVNEKWRQLGFSEPLQAVHFRVEEAYQVQSGKRTLVWQAHERREWLMKVPLTPVALPEMISTASPKASAIGAASKPSASNPVAPSVSRGASEKPVAALPRLELGKPVMVVLGEHPALDALEAVAAETVTVIALEKERENRAEKIEQLRVALRLQGSFPLYAVALFPGDAVERDIKTLSALFNFLGFFFRERAEGGKLKLILPSFKTKNSPALYFSSMNAVEAFIKTHNQMSAPDIEPVQLPMPMNSADSFAALPNALREKLLSMLAVPAEA